jgi:hypothetical protein
MHTMTYDPVAKPDRASGFNEGGHVKARCCRYGISNADVAAALGTYDVAGLMKDFLAVDLSGQIAKLNGTVQQMLADPAYDTFSNREAILSLQARLNDAAVAGPKLQTNLVDFNSTLSVTLAKDVELLLTAGGDCKWAGEDFLKVRNAVCTGVGGTVDMVWFIFLLSSIFMFGYIVSSALRLSPLHQDPCLPRISFALSSSRELCVFAARSAVRVGPKAKLTCGRVRSIMQIVLAKATKRVDKSSRNSEEDTSSDYHKMEDKKMTASSKARKPSYSYGATGQC